MLELNKIYNMDCLEGMRDIPDKYFDLVLTDPPYAHGKDIISSYQKDIFDSSWDKEFSKEYVDELIRISKNQIIFGAEHLSFMLPKSRGWIVWDKRLSEKENNAFSDCEIIWTSFDRHSRVIRYLWKGFRVDTKEVRYNHPTQKPLNLIIRLVKEYSKEGDKVFDGFIGTGTTAVACKHINRNFIGCDISKEYCDIANKRLQQENLLTILETSDNG